MSGLFSDLSAKLTRLLSARVHVTPHAIAHVNPDEESAQWPETDRREGVPRIV